MSHRLSFGNKNFRISLTKSGIGYSFGGKGFRYSKRANVKNNSGCLFNCISWTLMLCFYIIYIPFWLIYKLYYFIIKYCFIIPVKKLMSYIKNKKDLL